MPAVDLLCLANSYKEGGRCVAGLRMDDGGWVRPVSDTPKGELRPAQYRFGSQTEPRVLDVVRVGLSHESPLPYQPENWLIDNSRWQLLERPASIRGAEILASAISTGSNLFGDTSRSIAEQRFEDAPASESLVVIRPTLIKWQTEEGRSSSSKKGRVFFKFGNRFYDLPLTDPAYLPLVKALDVGRHDSEEIGISSASNIVLTISLAEPLNGQCYKLVAGVVVIPESWGGYL